MTRDAYEKWDDNWKVHVLWNSSDHLPPAMPRERYARRVLGLFALETDQEIIGFMDSRLRCDPDMAGEYEVATLHDWELWYLHRTGRKVRGLKGAWRSDDGIVNILTPYRADLSGIAAEADRLGIPLLRAWVKSDDEPLPYMFALIRP